MDVQATLPACPSPPGGNSDYPRKPATYEKSRLIDVLRSSPKRELSKGFISQGAVLTATFDDSDDEASNVLWDDEYIDGMLDDLIASEAPKELPRPALMAALGELASAEGLESLDRNSSTYSEVHIVDVVSRKLECECSLHKDFIQECAIDVLSSLTGTKVEQRSSTKPRQIKAALGAPQVPHVCFIYDS